MAKDFPVADRPRRNERMRRVAREEFNYEHLRSGQEAAIQSVLDGHDTLAVMPTGSGKSAIYQIGGVLLSGSVIIISPLIALQHDQVETLEAQDAGEAVQINSTLSNAEREDVFAELREQDLKYVFMAPEQFNNEETLKSLRATHPALFVVDEAHCISEWGHDFRPDYLRLGIVIEALGHPPVLALTATAAPPVREEIIERLGMRDPQIIVRGFDRPNIWLGVETFTDEDIKHRALIERVAEAEKPGIIYTATHRHAEEVANALCKAGMRAASYHAGMKAHEREHVQTAFLEDALNVIVATIAFGMGVDKPNVRFVFHYDISGSLDAYYQEIGRAGRDSHPARAILFYRSADIGLQRFLTSGSQMSTDEVEQVARVIATCATPIAPRALREKTHLTETKLMTALSRLEEQEAIRQLPTGEVLANTVLERESGPANVAEAVVNAQERYRQLERSRVEMMQGYAELHDGCRRKYLLNYFGEEYDAPCGNCDNCDAGRTVAYDESSKPFPLNSRVIHAEWGEGIVVRYESDKMVVLFESVGYKMLSIEIVTERELLKPATR